MDYSEAEERHRKTGNYLFFTAWAVEVLAASVGVVIAAVTAYGIHEEIIEIDGYIDGSGYVNMILGALPFLMVAVVELTKIPLATAFYNSLKKRWRLVFGFSLAFLIFITFETALNGFERNFANLTHGIEKLRRDLIKVDEGIAEYQSEIDGPLALDEQIVRDQASKRNEELQTARTNELAEIDQVIKDKVALSNTGLAATLKSSLSSVEQRITELKRNYQTTEDRIFKDFENKSVQAQGNTRSEQNLVEQQISTLDQQIRDLAAEEAQAINDANFFTVGGVRDTYEKRRADLVSQRTKLLDQLNSSSSDPRLRELTQERDKQLSQAKADLDRQVSALDRERQSINAKLSQNASSSERSLSSDIELLNEQKKEIQSKYDELQAKEEALLAQKIENLGNKGQKAEEIETQKQELSNRRLEIRDTINEKVADNQVYRITQLWTGKDNAADVSKDELRYTAIAWFGSLAAIVAATGTVLAFAALVMKDPHQREVREKKSLKAVLRRLAVDLRKYLRTPRVKTEYIDREKIVEVVKEVPVEKVVMQEVPREVIRKELVHVPLYTNDKELLGNSHLKEGQYADMKVSTGSIEKDVETYDLDPSPKKGAE